MEVESAILGMENVADVTVYGEKNPLVGNVVCAKIALKRAEDPREFAVKVKNFCSRRLERYKVPVKIVVDDEKQYGERYKKIRVVEPRGEAP